MFWLREIAGWALIAIGLIVLRTGLAFAMNTEETQIVEASVVLFAAVAVMRIGVLLIRISTAARICRPERQTDGQK